MANKKVLVVDDDAKTVELVKLYLNRCLSLLLTMALMPYAWPGRTILTLLF